MEVILIAAIDENRGIGYKNKLLKPIKEDLKRFQKLTLGHPIIMGKNTWDSLPYKPLKDRTNCVITRPGTSIDGILNRGNTTEEVLEYFEVNLFDKVYVIGGEKIYREALPHATKLEITHIKGKYKADRFFPEFSSQFKLKKKKEFEEFSFYTYNRKKETNKFWKSLTTKKLKNASGIDIIVPTEFGMFIHQIKKFFKNGRN